MKPKLMMEMYVWMKARDNSENKNINESGKMLSGLQSRGPPLSYNLVQPAYNLLQTLQSLNQKAP